MKHSYVYVAQCATGELYTGWTHDVSKRVAAHNAGKGAKYLRGKRLPVKLVYKREYDTKSLAMSVECAMKRLTRAQKLAAITAAGNELYTVAELCAKWHYDVYA